MHPGNVSFCHQLNQWVAVLFLNQGSHREKAPTWSALTRGSSVVQKAGASKRGENPCRAGRFLLLLQHLWGMTIQGDICRSCCLKMNINCWWSLYSSEPWPSNCWVQVTQPRKVPCDVNVYFTCRSMDAHRSASPHASAEAHLSSQHLDEQPTS